MCVRVIEVFVNSELCTHSVDCIESVSDSRH